MENSFVSDCKCRDEYKCHVHRREPYARAIQFSSGKKILVTRTGDGIDVTVAYSVEEVEQLIIDLQRALKAY
jgi:hypothetical protein